MAEDYNALCTREDKILDMLKGFEDQRTSYTGVMPQPLTVETIIPPKPKPLSEAVRKILGRFSPLVLDPEPIEDKPMLVYNGLLHAESVALGKELDSIREAKAHLYPIWQASRQEGSRMLCAAVLDDYRAMVAKGCAALVAVGDFMREHKAFTLQITEQGADFYHLRPFDMPGLESLLGDPADRSSRIRALLASAAEGGHFDLSTLPAAWSAPKAPTPAQPPAKPSRTAA